MLPADPTAFTFARAPSRHRERWMAAAAIFLSAWLCWPVLFAEHVEGFSAQIQSLAWMLAADGSVARHDLALPLVSQFILTSRSGVIDLLALINRLTGASNDAHFRLVTVASFALLVTASCRFAVRWGGMRWWVALLALAIAPGVVALGCAFNDSVVSAAFATAALACLDTAGSWRRYALSGVLAALAIQCRLDAVLALPFVAGVALVQRATAVHLFRSAAAFLGGLLPVLALLAWANGFTPLDTLRVAAAFAPAAGLLAGIAPACFFLGLLLPLPLLGGMRGERGWRAFAFVALPALLLAYALHAATEPRYFFPLLTPFLALHGGRGLERLIADMRRSRALSAVLAAAALALLLGPPLVLRIGDGPVALGGAGRMPLYWRQWQEAQAESFARVDRLVVDTRSGGAIVTTHWNDEFYVRLRLIEVGWRPMPAPAACRGLSLYARGDRRIVHVRLEPQYGRAFYRPETAALMLAQAGRCPLVTRLPGAWVTTFGTDADARTGVPEFADARFADPLEGPVGRETTPLLAIRWLPADTLTQVGARSGAFLAARRAALGTPAQMLDKYAHNYRALPTGL